MNKLYIIAIILFVFSSSCSQKEKQNNNYLIMLSLDGFRWDYPDKANTPTLDSLARVGVKAQSLKPCFPSKTFPNHYSIATGLYPDHHGLVLNRFHAEDLKKNYSISKRKTVTDGDFYGGTPIWNLAEEQGLTSATLFWVGASADVNGEQASHWSYYDEELPQQARIDSISKWLSMPESKRPHLIMWYYHEPDATAHKFGPESQNTIALVEQLDMFLNNFFTQMRKLPIYNKLNFIITSDHGMSQLSPDRIILLDKVIDTADLEYADGGNPVYNLKVKDGKLDKVLNSINNSKKHITAWKHGTVPEMFHYGTNIRTLDITVVSDSGWSIFWSWKQGNGLGTHGYRNTNKDMHAIFYAAGPAFKNGYKQTTFNNIDIYPLAGKILNLKLPEVDGKIENVKSMLKE
jgi:alkaline phosphatase D